MSQIVKRFFFIGTVLNVMAKKRVEAEREQLPQRKQTERAEAEAANRLKDVT